MARVVALGARQIQSQDPVATFGLHLVGIDLDGERYCAVKAAGEPLAAVDAGLFAVTDRLRAGDPDGSPLHLDLQVRFANAGDLRNDDNVVALAKHIQRRKLPPPLGLEPSHPLLREVSSAC